MNGLLQDLRYAIRQLRKSPGFTVVAVLTLALGIGANTAIFSIVDAIWLRPLPIHNPGSLIRISDQKPDHGDEGHVSYAAYQDYRTQATAFSGIAAVGLHGAVLKANGESKMLVVGEVSPNYFSVLGVSTTLGRTFTEAELQAPNPPPLVMLGYTAWRRYFGGDPQIAGKTIVIDGRNCVVAGVLPRGFRGTEPFVEPEVWIPIPTWLFITGDNPTDRPDREFDLLARLAPGHSLEQARLETGLIATRLAQLYPKTDAGRKINVAFERDVRNPFLRMLSALLLALATLVLLIACANVANLFLAHGESRRKEIATRIALGGTRARLVWQLTIEGVPLSMLGAAFAVLLAGWIIRLLPALMPATEVPIGFDFRLDGRVLLFASALSLISAALFGIVPAFHASRVAPITVMKEASGASPRQRRWSLANFIVVAQMAASLVLLTGAGLLVKTLMQVEMRDPGFDRHQQMVLMDPTVKDLPQVQLQPYLDDVISRVEAVPGVRHAAFARFIPFGVGGGRKKVVSTPAQILVPGEDGLRVGYTDVSPGYFATMGTRLIRGRAFTAADRSTSVKVIVISQASARQFSPGQDPLDKYLRVGGASGVDWQIVGIAQDATYNDLTESPQPYIYFPIAQDPAWEVTLAISTTTDADSMVRPLVRAVQEVNQDVPVFGAHTLEARMRAASYAQRFPAILVAVLGLLALMLATVGLYGVVSYSVTRRTHEIGVRIALGAEPNRILRLVVGRGLWLAGIRTAIGLAGALAVTRVLSSLLYGVSPADPATFAGGRRSAARNRSTGFRDSRPPRRQSRSYGGSAL
jgi:putative ABC transport system permease protein